MKTIEKFISAIFVVVIFLIGAIMGHNAERDSQLSDDRAKAYCASIGGKLGLSGKHNDVWTCGVAVWKHANDTNRFTTTEFLTLYFKDDEYQTHMSR